MDKWNGKVALVTGASVGIGKSIAIKLANYGMKVVGCARNLEQLNEITMLVKQAEKGEFFPCKCDLRKEGEILGMFEFLKEKFGTIHICVNNAGLAHKAPLLNGSTENWRDVLEVNILALSIVTREAISLMRGSGVDDGHIVNLNSLSGHRLTSNGMYCASKFAVTALTESLRKELREEESRIRVTGISPGMVETEFAIRMNPADPEKGREKYRSMHCLQADDIADAIVYALSAPPYVDVNDMFIRPVEQKF